MPPIDYKPLETAMRHTIDMAVHHAVSRFEKDLPRDQIGLVSRIAQAAAETAVEQFRSYANAELRLIEIDFERRYDDVARDNRARFIQSVIAENRTGIAEKGSL